MGDVVTVRDLIGVLVQRLVLLAEHREHGRGPFEVGSAIERARR